MAIDITKFVGRFVEEARDQIGQLTEGLRALESGAISPEGINQVFRAAHTIKGSARMLKLDSICTTAHHLEDVLGALREGRLGLDDPLRQLLYHAVDTMAGLVEHLDEHRDPAGLPSANAALEAALAQVASGEVVAEKPPSETQEDMQPQPSGDVAVPSPAEPEIDVRQEPGVGSKKKNIVVEEDSSKCSSRLTPHASLLTPHLFVAAQPKAPALGPSQLRVSDSVRVRIFKLDELVKLMGEAASSQARLHQRLHEMQTIERRVGSLPDSNELHQTLRNFSRQLKDDLQAGDFLMAELRNQALLMRMLPLAVVFDTAGRMLRELAYTVGKQVDCEIQGSEIELDRQMIDKLSDPLIHLLRNAVDHGLETPEERVAAGKPSRGRVCLKAVQDGGWVVIEVSDDGGGIPFGAVRDKAVSKGLLSAEKATVATEQEILNLIFLPGFSISPIITDLSGRGVGMDVVRQCIVADLQGTISLFSRPGMGTTFLLRLPLSLAVMRVLLVSAGGRPFGFTAPQVAELLKVPRTALLQVAARQAVIIRNELVPVVLLADLLRRPEGYPPEAARADADTRLLIVIRAGSQKLALEVDALLDERDMVIKSLPAHLRQFVLVSGMVTSGRNELVSLLHAPSLLELAGKLRQSRPETALGARTHATPVWKVLVVDDSLNTREIEKDVLEAHGYQVTLAEDGLDGINKALANKFDAVLTDVEMPNMDGFTLTQRLRQSEAYAATPIIIITSREKEEDKRRGIEAGADAYIVKSDFEQNNLVDTLRTLLG